MLSQVKQYVPSIPSIIRFAATAASVYCLYKNPMKFSVPKKVLCGVALTNILSKQTFDCLRYFVRFSQIINLNALSQFNKLHPRRRKIVVRGIIARFSQAYGEKISFKKAITFREQFSPIFSCMKHIISVFSNNFGVFVTLANFCFAATLPQYYHTYASIFISYFVYASLIFIEYHNVFRFIYRGHKSNLSEENLWLVTCALGLSVVLTNIHCLLAAVLSSVPILPAPELYIDAVAGVFICSIAVVTSIAHVSQLIIDKRKEAERAT